MSFGVVWKNDAEKNYMPRRFELHAELEELHAEKNYMPRRFELHAELEELHAEKICHFPIRMAYAVPRNAVGG